MRISTEAPHIFDKVVDLLGIQRFFEGRHDFRESSRSTAVGDDGFPGAVCFRCGLVAAGEIREGPRWLKPTRGLRCSSAIRTMAGGARCFVGLLARFRIRRAVSYKSLGAHQRRG